MSEANGKTCRRPIILHETEEDARAAPEDGRRLFVISWDGHTRFAWANPKGGETNVCQTVFKKVIGGKVYVADNRKGSSAITKLLTENQRLRAEIEELKKLTSSEACVPCSPHSAD